MHGSLCVCMYMQHFHTSDQRNARIHISHIALPTSLKNAVIGNGGSTCTYFMHACVTGCVCNYHIAQNFGGKKLWRIWRFATNSPRFYPPKPFILAILLCKVANPPMFCLPKCLLVAIHQSFLLPKFCAIRYIKSQ